MGIIRTTHPKTFTPKGGSISTKNITKTPKLFKYVFQKLFPLSIIYLSDKFLIETL
jgi:hypothetical protein